LASILIMSAPLEYYVLPFVITSDTLPPSDTCLSQGSPRKAEACFGFLEFPYGKFSSSNLFKTNLAKSNPTSKNWPTFSNKFNFVSNKELNDDNPHLVSAINTLILYIYQCVYPHQIQLANRKLFAFIGFCLSLALYALFALGWCFEIYCCSEEIKNLNKFKRSMCRKSRELETCWNSWIISLFTPWFIGIGCLYWASIERTIYSVLVNG